MITAACALSAQVVERTASMRGGGGPNNGKCTIEVVVDGAAQVEIRGNRAFLRNLSGRPAQWRRFECNSVMPPNPGNFEFRGIDGRGRQSLVSDPRGNRGAAVVLIEDPQNGQEGYTFDIMWSGQGYGAPPPAPPLYGGGYRGPEDRFARLFQRVRDDLNQARNGFRNGGDQYRLDRTFQQLDDLQRDYVRGNFNRGQLDDVIDALRRVVSDNRLSRHDRDNLNGDLEDLRSLRDRR
jgi:hypothetical protein